MVPETGDTKAGATTVDYRRHTTHIGGGRPALRSALAALLLFAMLAWPLASANALTYPVNITINGAFGDWTAVLADSDNTATDGAGAGDDDPVVPGADLIRTAFTWNPTNLYFYMQYASQEQLKLENRIYVDIDGDGLMESTDLVVVYSYNPNGKALPSGIASYTPADPAGDPMYGSGASLSGTLGGITKVDGVISSNVIGAECEMAVPWSALGVAAGSPINLQFATLDINGTQTIDNVDVSTTAVRALTLVPDNAATATGGETVDYTHTLTNTGNAADTYDLAATSSLGWAVAIIDPATNTEISYVTVAASATADLVVRVTVPGSPAEGATDATVLTATSLGNSSVSAGVTDTTSITVPVWITLTIDRDIIDFGDLLPEQPSGVEQIVLTVDSNVPYTISREVTGSVAEMGLDVTGTASGAKPSGPNTWVDSYQATAPWTTAAEATLSATVQYTVVP